MSGKSAHLYQSGVGYNPKANTTCGLACIVGCFFVNFFCLCVFHKVRDTAASNAPIDFSFDLSSAFMQIIYPLLYKTQMKNTPKNLPIISIVFWHSHCHGPNSILTSLTLYATKGKKYPDRCNLNDCCRHSLFA